MALTPAQILRIANRTKGSGSTFLRAGSAAADPLVALLANKPPKNDNNSDSIFDSIKEGAAGAIGKAGRGLDTARAYGLSGALELHDATRAALGKGKRGDFESKSGTIVDTGFSLSDLKANAEKRIGFGDVLDDPNMPTAGLPLNAKRILGLAGDIAFDPLTYLTAGTGTAAKAGLKKVAAASTDDVAKILGREGVEAADSALARQAAASVPAGAGQSAAATAVEAPSVRGILSEAGLTDKALERTLRNIDRTGRGGIRLGGKTLVEGDTIAPLIDWARLPSRSAKLKGTALGKTVREGIVPLTKSRDRFPKATEELSTLWHEVDQAMSASRIDLDNKMLPVWKKVGPEQRDLIRNAMDIGGSESAARNLLVTEGFNDAARALDMLIARRHTSYQTLIKSGYEPGVNLMGETEYLSHWLSREGADALGIDPDLFRRGGGASGGTPKKRVIKGSIDKKNAALADSIPDGVAAYTTDPFQLVKMSAAWADEVGGKVLIWNRLDDMARETGEALTSTAAKPGFTRIAPKHYVADAIHNDLFKMAKAGKDNTLVKGWESVNGVIKTQTLFNPISFPAYVTQNLATGIGMHVVDGFSKVDFPIGHLAVKSTHSAFKKGLENFDSALKAAIPDPQIRGFAKEAWDQGHISPKSNSFDDIVEGTVGGKITKALKFGTKHTTAMNQYVEELLRASGYIRNRKMGLSVNEASKLVRSRQIDYSAVGRTAFERNIINRFVFFPSFLLRAPTAIVRAYAQKPGLALAQMKVEQGSKWYERDFNEYGEVAGARLSGAMSFGRGLLGGETPVALGDVLNPVLNAVLNDDTKSRSLAGVIPPLANIMGSGSTQGRVQGVLSDSDKRSKYLRALLGVRTGTEFGLERAEDELQKSIDEKAANGQALSAAEILAVEATKVGVEGAAELWTGDLVEALVEKGYTPDDLRALLSSGEASTTKLAPRPVLDINSLLGSGTGAREINELLNPWGETRPRVPVG